MGQGARSGHQRMPFVDVEPLAKLDRRPGAEARADEEHPGRALAIGYGRADVRRHHLPRDRGHVLGFARIVEAGPGVELAVELLARCHVLCFSQAGSGRNEHAEKDKG